MVYAYKLKKQIQRDILTAVHSTDIDMGKFIAKQQLETGFTHKTISEIIENMNKLGYIQIYEGVIKKMEAT